MRFFLKEQVKCVIGGSKNRKISGNIQGSIVFGDFQIRCKEKKIFFRANTGVQFLFQPGRAHILIGIKNIHALCKNIKKILKIWGNSDF